MKFFLQLETLSPLFNGGDKVILYVKTKLGGQHIECLRGSAVNKIGHPDWGYLKEQVYTRSFNNDEEVKQSIIEEEILRIPQNFFVRAYYSFVKRCYQCVAVDGLEFE
ncbi:hypothetical protein J6590_038141 [Homalodisca vitripennis]|nr:hypothetical protein J6590_038141 [Homalodisca vitripennis]